MRIDKIEQPKRKVTWKDVYEDFKRRFPRRRSEVLHWHPYDVGTILLYFEKGVRARYEYDRHELKFVRKEDLRDS